MLNESIPTESARTASSTVLRMTWSPSRSCPDSSTVTGAGVSNPNSNSSADIVVSLLSSRACCELASSAPGHPAEQELERQSRPERRRRDLRELLRFDGHSEVGRVDGDERG